MNLPKYKGKRIRASDKSLVYRFSLSTLLLLFVAVVLLLNLKQLMRTDWEQFSLLDNGLTLSAYNFITNLVWNKDNEVSQFELVLHKDSNWKIIG